MSRVRDIVDCRELFSVEEHHSVAEVARKMADLHVGAILVLNGEQLRGVFSERDLMKRVVAEGRDPAATRVGDVMNTDIVKVYDADSVETAASAMRSHHVRHAVIVDRAEHYLALLSERHLLYDVMNALEAKVGDLTGYIMTDGPGG